MQPCSQCRLLFIFACEDDDVCNKCKKLNETQSQIDIRRIKVLINLLPIVPYHLTRQQSQSQCSGCSLIIADLVEPFCNGCCDAVGMHDQNKIQLFMLTC